MIAIGKVIAAEAPVHAGAAIGSAAHAVLKKGDRVEIGYEFLATTATPGRRTEDARTRAPYAGWALVSKNHITGWVAPGAVRRQPLFMVDASHYQGTLPNWEAVYKADYAVVGLKISQGLKYPHAGWGKINWGRVRAAAGDKFGVSRFRTGYHWASVKESPDKQVEYMLSIIDSAGGFGAGDLVPVLDLERGGNEGCSAKEVADWCRAFAHHMISLTGWAPILYTGSFSQDLKIDDCDTWGFAGLWAAQYGDNLDRATYEGLGFGVRDLFGWQYAAGQPSGAKTIHGELLPYGIPGYGKGDTTIVFCKGFDELVARWGTRFARTRMARDV